MIDTHSHIYLEEFDADRAAVIERAKAAGVSCIVLPNIEIQSISAMQELEKSDRQFFRSAIGLHPTYVRENFQEEIDIVEQQIAEYQYIAIGEIGLDYYWDKTYIEQQQNAFEQQILLASKYNLPVIIHCRDAFDDCFEIVRRNLSDNLRGVFHSFGGSVEQAEKIISLGNFKIGINGIVTYKNSGLDAVLPSVPLKYIVIETDAPYLTPVPFRGKRNESSYLKFIVDKLSSIYCTTPQTIDKATSENARELFGDC